MIRECRNNIFVQDQLRKHGNVSFRRYEMCRRYHTRYLFVN